MKKEEQNERFKSNKCKSGLVAKTVTTQNQETG